VHAYLETIGVINVGHQLAPPPARPYNPQEKQRTAPEAGPQDKEKVALQASRDKEEHDQEEALRRRFSNVLPVTS